MKKLIDEIIKFSDGSIHVEEEETGFTFDIKSVLLNTFSATDTKNGKLRYDSLLKLSDKLTTKDAWNKVRFL